MKDDNIDDFFLEGGDELLNSEVYLLVRIKYER
jgi:hypothetical protein